MPSPHARAPHALGQCITSCVLKLLMGRKDKAKYVDSTSNTAGCNVPMCLQMTVPLLQHWTMTHLNAICSLLRLSISHSFRCSCSLGQGGSIWPNTAGQFEETSKVEGTYEGVGS